MICQTIYEITPLLYDIIEYKLHNTAENKTAPMELISVAFLSPLNSHRRDIQQRET